MRAQLLVLVQPKSAISTAREWRGLPPGHVRSVDSSRAAGRSYLKSMPDSTKLGFGRGLSRLRKASKTKTPPPPAQQPATPAAAQTADVPATPASLEDETHDAHGVSALRSSLMSAVMHGGMLPDRYVSDTITYEPPARSMF